MEGGQCLGQRRNQLEVTLEDLYNGTSMKFYLSGKVLDVLVEKGMQNGQKITLPGEADEAPDCINGDIVFVLQQKDHPKFKRKGDDLFFEHKISLKEALFGFEFILTHLNGRQILISSIPGEVVKPDQVMTINDEGMPIYQRPFMRGVLYIHFTVEFPDSLNLDQWKIALGAVLPMRAQTQLSGMKLDEFVETTLHDVNVEEEMRMKQTQVQDAYNEDDDMHGRARSEVCSIDDAIFVDHIQQNFTIPPATDSLTGYSMESKVNDFNHSSSLVERLQDMSNRFKIFMSERVHVAAPIQFTGDHVMSPTQGSSSFQYDKFQKRITELKELFFDQCLEFINNASKEDLIQFKGIGERRAEHIIQLREDCSTPIKKMEDLNKRIIFSKQLKGIILKILEEI